MKLKSVRQNLLGSLEVALFMPAGPQRFCATHKSMMKSFLVPLFILPLTLATVLTAHPDGNLSTATMQVLSLVYILRTFVYLGLFLGFVYMMAKNLDRMDSFYRFVTANNWLALPAAVLSAPLLFMFWNGGHAWSEIYPMMVIVTLYSYAYTAFMATYVLRIPKELACFIAIAGMAINQTSLDVVKWAAVQVVYLIS